MAVAILVANTDYTAAGLRRLMSKERDGQVVRCLSALALILKVIHEDLPDRAPASSAVVTTAACLAMTLSSSIACSSASGSAQQSRTTTNR